MKMVTKMLAFVMASSCLLVGALAVGEPSQIPPDAPKLLFVMKMEDATLQHIKGKNYRLITPIKDLQPVLTFSDRPYRIAFRLDRATFFELVHNGDDSFTTDPPNIVLNWEGEGTPTAVYTLESYKKDEHNLVYFLRLIKAEKGYNAYEGQEHSGRLGLYMDSVSVTHGIKELEKAAKKK
jgi:hypothetical protein